jgi:hypothetical protein
MNKHATKLFKGTEDMHNISDMYTNTTEFRSFLLSSRLLCVMRDYISTQSPYIKNQVMRSQVACSGDIRCETQVQLQGDRDRERERERERQRRQMRHQTSWECRTPTP